MQNRRDFLKRLAALGLLPPLVPISACGGSSSSLTEVQADSVIVIGAGAAGMTAAFHLLAKGIDVQILEASDQVGGRMRTDQSFADFPVPLGAEWLHVEESVLEEASAKPFSSLRIETRGYQAENDYGLWDGNQLILEALSPAETSDRKFRDSSWLAFFEQHLLPNIQSRIHFNTQVSGIEYQDSSVSVSATNGNIYSADLAIICLPLSVLKNDSIRFSPSLPVNKQEAIEAARIWPGFKAFMKFPEAFYPTFLELAEYENHDGDLLFYDAAFGHSGTDQVLGCFCVGEPAQDFIHLDESQIRQNLLNKLDPVFGNQPSQDILQFTHMNWSQESPYSGTYLYDNENYRVVQTLSASIDDRLFFAGEAFTNGEDWGGVHDAIRSALRAVDRIRA